MSRHAASARSRRAPTSPRHAAEEPELLTGPQLALLVVGVALSVLGNLAAPVVIR